MYNDQVKLMTDLSEPLTVKLAGSNNIDAKLLSDTIKSFVDIFQGAKDEISEDTSIQLQVEAFRDGSFIIDFKAIFEILSSNEGANLVTIAGGIVSTVVCVIKFAKHLQGKKPKKVEIADGENVKIENFIGDIITIDKSTYNIYANPNVSQSVSKIFDSLNEDNSRDTLIVESKENSVCVDRKEYKPLSHPVILDSIDPEKKEISNRFETWLEIKKVDLSGKSKWDFYYNKIITASIEDEEFLERVSNSDIRFGSKDKIYVRLRETKELSEDGSFIAGTERYIIEKVIDFKTKEDFMKNQVNINDLL